MTETDMINQPPHYIASNGMEVIDVIDAFTEGLEGYKAAYTANVIKYICRWPHKDGIKDLKKARRYLDRLIMKLEEEESDEEREQNSIPFNPNGFIPPSLDYLHQPSSGFIGDMSKCCSCKAGL